MLNNKRWAFAFSGIESLSEDAVFSFYQRHSLDFDPILSRASAYSGFNLREIITKRKIIDLLPSASQVLTYTYSTAVSEIIKGHDIKPLVVAGFSLGVYAALWEMESVSFETGLLMVQKAYELMEVHSTKAVFAMSAVVGLKNKEIWEILQNNNLDSIQRVNTLNSTCHIYAGLESELEKLNRLVKMAGAITANFLQVAIPYHHPQFLKEASREFRKFLKTLNWQNGKIPLISSIDQSEISCSNDLIEFVAENLCTPIHWQAVIEKIAALGINHIAECGPGITLTQNARFVEVDLKFLNVKNMQRRMDI